MPFFLYRCQECGTPGEEYAPLGQTPPSGLCGCGGPRRRVFTPPAIVRGALDWEPHYNKAVGSVVHNKGEFRSELSRASDEASERTGVPHNYEPIDYRDAPGVDKDLWAKQKMQKSGVSLTKDSDG